MHQLSVSIFYMTIIETETSIYTSIHLYIHPSIHPSIYPSIIYTYNSATSSIIITWILLQNRPQISEANIPGVGHVDLQEFLPEVSQLVGEQCVCHHIHADLLEVAPLHELVQSMDDI